MNDSKRVYSFREPRASKQKRRLFFGLRANKMKVDFILIFECEEPLRG